MVSYPQVLHMLWKKMFHFSTTTRFSEKKILKYFLPFFRSHSASENICLCKIIEKTQIQAIFGLLVEICKKSCYYKKVK